MATIVTRSGKGSPLTHAEVDSNFTNLNTDKLELSGGTMTGNLSFGDNDKAIFGAGSDLQIYHEGNHSFIKDTGTGDLKIQATNFWLQNAAGSKNSIRAVDGAEVNLYYNSALKLATTSTGIDVTGTVTADGLTVDGDAFVQGSSGATLTLKNTNTTVTSGDLLGQLDFYNSDPSGDGPSVQARIKATSAFSTGNGASLGFFTTIAGSGIEGAAPIERMKINQSGDISFYEDTGTTAKFFWDASAESLGIGTSSPAALLDLKHNSASTHLRLTENTSGNWTAFGVDTSDNLRVYVNNSERMRIDSSGNLLVGKTSSLTSNTRAEFANTDTSTSISSGAGSAISIQNLSTTNNTYSSIYFTNGGGGVDSAIYGLHEVGNGTGTGRTGSLVFATANLGGGAAEAMRIDSSGNLLVGKTSSSFGTTGIELQGDGELISTRAGTTAYFNRTSTDGDIVGFYKDGTTVGSIGTEGGDVTIGKAGSGLQFRSADPCVRPHNMTTNSPSDATVDLGRSNTRFKDLYLSGGVYLGGTGAANKLDDYEEGTFTPTVGLDAGSGTFSTWGSYVKIGKQVTVTIRINIDTASSALMNVIGSMPFTPENLNQQAVGSVRENASTGRQWHLRATGNNTSFLLRRYDNDQAISAGYQFIGSVTYFTA